MQADGEAFRVAMQVLEAIREAQPALIADNMPPGWGMNRLRAASQPPATPDERWQRDDIQFPRLLAEISATQDHLDLQSLAESMDLSVDEVNELFDRAGAAWEATKAQSFERDRG